jgi:hypothetical protein
MRASSPAARAVTADPGVPHVETRTNDGSTEKWSSAPGQVADATAETVETPDEPVSARAGSDTDVEDAPDAEESPNLVNLSFAIPADEAAPDTGSVGQQPPADPTTEQPADAGRPAEPPASHATEQPSESPAGHPVEPAAGTPAQPAGGQPAAADGLWAKLRDAAVRLAADPASQVSDSASQAQFDRLSAKEQLAYQIEQLGGPCLDPAKFTETDLTQQLRELQERHFGGEPAAEPTKIERMSRAEEETSREREVQQSQAEYHARHPNSYDQARGDAVVLGEAMDPSHLGVIAGAARALYLLGGDDPATATRKAALVEAVLGLVPAVTPGSATHGVRDAVDPAVIPAEVRPAEPDPTEPPATRPQAAEPHPAEPHAAEPVHATPTPAGPPSWADLFSRLEEPQARQSVNDYRSQAVRVDDRGVIAIEGTVGAPMSQDDSMAHYTLRLPGEHRTHAVGLQLGENLPEGITSAPASALNLSEFKTVENRIRAVADIAAEQGGYVETHTRLMVEYRHTAASEVPVLVGVVREAAVRLPGSEPHEFLRFAAVIDPATRVVTVTANSLH